VVELMGDIKIRNVLELKIKKNASAYFDKNADRYNSYYADQNEYAKWNRHVAIINLVQKYITNKEEAIVDIGCGPGYLAFDLAERGFYGVGMDISPNMLKICHSKVGSVTNGELWTFEEGDSEKMRFKDSSFSCAIASGVLEYMPSDEGMFKEVSRVLKPKGFFICSVTNLFGYTTCLNPISDKVKSLPGVLSLASIIRKSVTKSSYGATSLGFNPRKHFLPTFKKRLRKHGFSVVEDFYLHFTLFPAPLSTIFERVTGSLDKKLDILDKTPLRHLGACYIAIAQKESK
jgi:ubiquinone/menaquinone biosynthesis C-methylase UbiE